MPYLLIFFVTARCNSRCSSCFYSKNINDSQEIAIDKIEKISMSIPNFNNLLFSGGEPFLRADLGQIINLFVQNSRIRTISIPTNGILTDRILSVLEEIIHNKISININFSLDGHRETHNELRGVDCFDSCLNSIEEVCKLKDKYNNLRVLINSIICSKNYNELYDLTKSIRKNFAVDGHYFEIIRGDITHTELKKISPVDLARLYNDLLRIQSGYILNSNDALLTKIWTIGKLIHQYKLQYNNYIYGLKWNIDCFAGRRAAVIDHKGNVSACELRGSIMNLRQTDYNFNKIWISGRMRKEYNNIKEANCDCTHVCFIDTSQQQYKIHLAYNFWKFYNEYQKKGIIEF